MIDLVIEGGDELYAVAKRLRGADKVIRKEMLQGIRTAAKPLTAKARAGAADLPRRGGLAALVGRSRFSVQTKTAARTAGVRIVARNTHDIGGMDRGRLRHPVFGTKAYVNQAVRPGWFSDPLKHAADTVRPEIMAAIARAASHLEKG